MDLMAPTLTVFLQNAWSPHYAGKVWPRRSWLYALSVSRSGTRLRVLIDDFSVCENTTLAVGAHPSSTEPPDEAHITATLAERRPQVVVACGKQAEAVLQRLWLGPLLVIPHPAHRLLTDQLYREARAMLTPAFRERTALRQRRGAILREPLGSAVPS